MGLSRVLRPLFVLTAMAVPATAVHAQRYWHDEQGRSAFRFDVGLPFLKGDGHKFFTGSLVPSLSLRADDGVRIEADVPVARAGGEDGSAIRLGNLYLGLRIGDDDKAFTGILGLRLPTSKSPSTAIAAQALAAGATEHDDFEAYSPNMLTFRGGLEYHKVRSSGLMFGARGAGSLQMNTSGDPTLDSEISFDYGARTGYEGSRLLATLALTGRYLITAPHHDFGCAVDDEDCNPKGFNERTHHRMTGMVELRAGSIRPRVSLAIPFDKDLRDIAGAVLGLGISIGR
jgi:hypothetical protein